MEGKFKYKAINEAGDVVQGSLEAKSISEAASILRTKGTKPIHIEKEEEKSKEITFGTPKFKLKDLVLFSRQSSTMLNAGMALNRCLDVLIEQNKNKHLRKITREVAVSVQKGETLSNALYMQGNAFPDLFKKTVEAGEMTGQLAEVLEKMAVHYEKERRIRTKIKGAMMYPIILSIIATVAVTILLVFVMPKFMEIFAASNVEFPALTLMVMALSKLLVNYWYIILLVIAGLVLLVINLLKQPQIRLSFDRFKLKFRLIRDPMTKIVTSRFTRTLSTLLSSGINVVSALETAGQTTQNTYVEESLKSVVTGIEKGMSMTTQLEKTKIFPPMMLSMIAIGEESGNLEAMLEKTADYYDEELEAAMQQMVSLIEPIMIVVMGLLIGTIVIAMYLPMFSVFETLQ
ncbi:type II secretion system F family protein [Filifactor villosus]|uniref:Type II secretion system F family protein n=1 Tax=Filifactor villosus TaxID=29374 RepID=A0ABV9QKB1_9FIRM